MLNPRNFFQRGALIYSTTVVKRGDLVATISATGTIEPVEVVDVGAQVAGRILSLGTDKDGEFARPVQVKIGTSDGALSAVTADELREGQAVITGEIVAAAQTDAKNPFLPKAQQRR